MSTLLPKIELIVNGTFMFYFFTWGEAECSSGELIGDWGPELWQALVEAGRLEGCHVQHGGSLAEHAPQPATLREHKRRWGGGGPAASLPQPSGGALRYHPRGAAPIPGRARRAPPLSRPAEEALPKPRGFPCPPPQPVIPPLPPAAPDPPAPPGPARPCPPLDQAPPPSAKGPRVRVPELPLRALQPRVRIPRPPHPGARAARKMW